MVTDMILCAVCGLYVPQFMVWGYTGDGRCICIACKEKEEGVHENVTDSGANREGKGMDRK